MATKNFKVIAKVISTSYKSTTSYGNNVYFVEIETQNGERMKGYTLPNAAIGYYINNSPFRNYCVITCHYTKSGALVLESAKSL